MTAQRPQTVPASIFRAYDIRGIVDETLTETTVEVIGRAIGSEAAARGESTVVVARDGRLSGPRLQEALIRGLTASGRNVIDVGMVPTPVLYFATHVLEGTASGVMVTGSHNPPDYNGFKIVLGGETLSGDAITALYQRIQQDDLTEGQGQVRQEDVREAYLARVLCAEKAMEIGTNGVQVFGGAGFIRDYPLEMWYRNLRAVGLLEGAVMV
jgi:phosphomannomutase/phosphoglucomutase